MEKEHGRREDVLRQEISDLQQVNYIVHNNKRLLKVGRNLFSDECFNCDCLICINVLQRLQEAEERNQELTQNVSAGIIFCVILNVTRSVKLEKYIVFSFVDSFIHPFIYPGLIKITMLLKEI